MGYTMRENENVMKQTKGVAMQHARPHSYWQVYPRTFVKLELFLDGKGSKVIRIGPQIFKELRITKNVQK